MAPARKGDTVRVHYMGKLEDGSVFDSSANREPLEFTIGAGTVLGGFEQSVIGMNPGETRQQKISAEQAYGLHRKEMMIELPKDEVPSDLNPKVGDQLWLEDPMGRKTSVMVTDVSESGITLDANHPLAGKDLYFQIDLVEILTS
ncbi:MAG: peptidylprolyl isomerase [Acidobacteria bacterium]|nr:peptidylprolyl isomerase [Acidobacteriota bacterium]